MVETLWGVVVEHGNELAFLFTSLSAFLLLGDLRRPKPFVAPERVSEKLPEKAAKPPSKAPVALRPVAVVRPPDHKGELKPGAKDDPKLEPKVAPDLPIPEPAPEPAIAAVPAKQQRLTQTTDRLFGKLRNLLRGGSAEREELFRALEESLITGDVGVITTEALLSTLRKEIPSGTVSKTTLEEALRQRMATIFDEKDGKPLQKRDGLSVVALVGVNGVGKTTTAGKLARKLSDQGSKVLLAACDTFRAAAVEQLKLWGERSGIEVISGAEGAKPSTVAFAALQRAVATGADFLLIDTAGRLHTKSNLMQELDAVLKLIGRELPGAPHETILVVDATSGQNALEQARVFHGVAPLSGLVVTKLDGTPRGGMLFAIRRELGIPVRYIGLGEQAEDLKAFDSSEFLTELFGETTSNENVELPEPAARIQRRRRAE